MSEAKQVFELEGDGGTAIYAGAFKPGTSQDKIMEILTRPDFSYEDVVKPLLALRDDAVTTDPIGATFIEQSEECGVSWRVNLDTRTLDRITINGGEGGIRDEDRNGSNSVRERIDLQALIVERKAKAAAYGDLAKSGDPEYDPAHGGLGRGGWGDD